VTRIDFYHDAQDKLAVACELIGECHRAGRRVLVYAPDPAVAAAIDRLLWVQPATGFVPHCNAGSALAAHTPIVVASTVEVPEHDDVLVNLDGELPAGFSRFHRLIEVVGSDDADRVPARGRYKHYRDRGYELHTQSCEARRT
jgi:DNA polymerase-3 subunit chi